MRTTGLAAMLALTACGQAQPEPVRYPDANRPVAPIVAPRYSDERSRDNAGEAADVMRIAGVVPGMTVADIGAGEGYYTLRLAERVGSTGRVVAQDIVPATRDALADRVSRERLDNVYVRLGAADDPRLPAGSFDRVFMVHMYHEIVSPYAFMHRLRAALKPGARVVIVDSDRPTQSHGIPPALLTCELGAVGYRRVALTPLPRAASYVAVFEAGEAVAPARIRPCRAGA